MRSSWLLPLFLTLYVLAAPSLAGCDLFGPEDDERPQGRVVFTKFDTTTQMSFVYAMNTDGSDLTQLSFKDEPFVFPGTNDTLPSFGSAYSPRWSSDGKHIAYEASFGFDESHIVLMNADGSEKRNLTPPRGYAIGPEWSPDGRRLLYQQGTYLGAIVAAYVVELGSSNSNCLDLENEACSRVPIPRERIPYKGQSVRLFPSNVRWGPRPGTFYVRGSTSNDPADQDARETYVVDASTGRIIEQVTPNRAFEGLYDISPDGTRSLFAEGDYGENRKIYIAPIERGAAKALTSGPHDSHPEWANDSRHAVYVKAQDGNSSSLHLVDAQTSEAWQASSLLVDSSPADLFIPKAESGR